MKKKESPSGRRPRIAPGGKGGFRGSPLENEKISKIYSEVHLGVHLGVRVIGSAFRSVFSSK